MHLKLNQKELVLDPTTDETCNLSALSLRDETTTNQQHQESKKELIDEDLCLSRLYHRQYSSKLRKTSIIHDRRASIQYPQLILQNQLCARDVVLRRCKQFEPLPFEQIYSAQSLRQCRKIGEGVFSEVFMNKTPSGRPVILKIIPIEGNQLINGEIQKKYDEILAEIIIACELTELKNGDLHMTDGFVEAINVHCVQGRYPNHLIDLWELYSENQQSENDHPEIFDDDQLYIVFEQAYAGQDIEAFQFENAQQTHSALLQIAITLAIAERCLEFEHRDLHWGNVLISRTDEKTVQFKIDGEAIVFPTHGVKATIIDFTLSRMSHNGCRLYNDLAHDNDLFTSTGDYQFDIYRLMKSRLNNNWSKYDPYTNILWLHYMVDKMISGVRYKSSKTRKHRTAIDELMQTRDELLEFKSAADFIQYMNENNNHSLN